MKLVLNGQATWVNYHHLYCFYVVATEGGLTPATQRLGIGASALSIQMKQLEHSLGFSLFERSHRKLALNEQGRVVLSYAQEIFRLGSEMMETLHDRPTAARIHLKVGALDAIPKHLSSHLVSQALAFPSSKHPGSRQSDPPCSVSIIEGSPRVLLEQLTAHRIDLILMNFLPPSPPGQLTSRQIARLPLTLVGSKAFLPLRRGFPDSLNGVPVIVPTADSRVRQEFESFCKGKHLKPDLLIEAQDAMLQKLLALQGRGLIVMPAFAVKEYLDNKELFQIGTIQGVYEEWFLISASRKIENPVASRLMKHFKIQ